MIHPRSEGGSGLKIPILFGIVIALLAANVYLFLQVDQMKAELATTREAILNEVSGVRETTNISAQASRRNLDNLRDELETARRQASAAAGQAKVDATAHADELSRRLEEEQRQAQQQVQSQISQVAESTSAKIGDVNQDLQLTKAELDKTIGNLTSTRGDLGVQSGLIATNAQELQALRELGERNYFEFKLTKSKTPIKLADITILLKRTDPKRNRYTVEVVADDKRFEKKDKNVLEPVQFYMSRYRQPYEIVVNEISKDLIAGYLSQPKVRETRAAN
jgi:hypothetical protein